MTFFVKMRNWAVRKLLAGLEPIDWELFTSPTLSGVSVTPEKSLRNTAVLRAVFLLSETVAQIPCGVFNEQTKKPYKGSQLYKILSLRPNKYMTSFDFRLAMMVDLLTRGNAFAEIEINNKGQVIGLYPLSAAKMQILKDEKENIWYKYESDNLYIGEVLFRENEVLHIKALHNNGLWGKSPIQFAREAVGLSLAAEDYGATFFGSGGKPDGVLATDIKLGADTIERLKKQWKERKLDKTLILEEGLKYQSISLPPEDSQFIETRKFQVAEIARMFGVPPHMLGDLERATFSNIEHQGINFVTYSVMPWIKRIEQEMENKLLSETEQEVYSIRFRVEGLLRGDTKSRYEAYATGRSAGFLSANDVREKEDMPAITGGDEYNNLLNTIPASLVMEYWEAKIKAANKDREVKRKNEDGT